MKKLLLAGLPVLIIFMGLPLMVSLMVVMSTTAAAECRTQTNQTAPTELGDLGVIDGPVGGPVKGKVTLAQANIPRRSGLDGFRASMPKVLSTNPDFVTLNEASGWTLAQIEAAAPGYGAFRVADHTGDNNSMGNVVLWKRDTWSKANGGRVTLVVDDNTYYQGRAVTWDRFATWVILERADGAVVSVISTHHMTNPHKYPRQHGNPPLTRPQQYGAGMDILLQLRNSLATHGPVLIGGDMNTHASYTDLPWAAAARMKAAGYGWHNHAVDFVFFPQHQGVRLERGWSGTMVSDHHWISARLSMNGAGPESAPAPAATSDGVVNAAHTTRTAAEPPSGDVLGQLMRLRFASSYPTMTAEQARNAITIAQVARDLQVPRRGLQVAIATAIQESKLVNLTGGDRDSGGLFQQRPSQGWGSRAEVTNPVLAARAFFGEAQHTGNPGLLDIPGWQKMPLTQAAQAVQRSGYPDAYAQWEDVAGDITDLLGGDLPDLPDDGSTTNVANCQGETVNPVTVGTLNLLGAGHTDKAGERPGYDTWDKRLPGAMRTIENAGVTIAGLQEVHGPQAQALENQYAAKWGIYPASGKAQNRVIWDRNEWKQTDGRLVDIPYFGGKDVGMPLVQLTSTTTGQVIWVWSIHNPANTHGDAAAHRKEALRRQLATMTDVAGTGVPAVILGDFNDGKDGSNSSHCALTPELTNAFGGSAEPCKKPKKDAPIDHIYGADLTWASAEVDNSTQASKIADHPLVVATTAGSSAGCAVAQATNYNLGPVKPQLTQLVNILGPMFDIKTVGGYRESATDPNGHPAGLAADFMVPLTPAGKAQGDALVAYAQAHARELGIDYIIWYQRIWSVARADEGWRRMEDRGSATANHMDHPHINVLPDAKVTPIGLDGAPCDEVVYPVPAQYIGADRKNWHDTGPYWSNWHTGTDFSAPCGTTVYAAHAGTIEIDTSQGWAGPQLVKVTTGPGSLTTWYAHMQSVSVSRGQTVAAGEPIGQVGKEGNGSGCHLHFEVHLKNGSIYGPDNVDPSAWLAENASKPTRSV
ncbi:peptidoglycan DD-metalloendopeptidase family protein [Nocardioides sp. TRM66260-LWL]|uniref:peptidoglycan DD-metalloendopeptidase family protein n=1 Tax=Nocardioides sp. TRM66260-LWL TaxID=2874478 RepID=UPI001CC7375A|nr:peptidoglycan DD-metalloendopeptidase family protein [Nocardioides sp. TRM66260-LWL]MBZ5733579.1 peptidoglycan DD-metalloendopeptidase family protein [Nocardioides sp. TRM66260-LWL]